MLGKRPNNSLVNLVQVKIIERDNDKEKVIVYSKNSFNNSYDNKSQRKTTVSLLM